MAVVLARSIDGVARRVELDAADPERQERAGKLRELARSQPMTPTEVGEAMASAPHAPAKEGHADRGKPISDKAERYTHLEEQLKQRDAARATGKGQHRDDGRRR